MLCYFADVVVYLLRREGEKNKKRRLTKTPSRHNKRGRRNELASALLSRPSFPSIRCGFPFPFHRSRASLRLESYAPRTRPPRRPAMLCYICMSRAWLSVSRVHRRRRRDLALRRGEHNRRPKPTHRRGERRRDLVRLARSRRCHWEGCPRISNGVGCELV
jgi:hypothetical protein